jgi:long-chain acyl-CoA synthetase
MSVQTLPQLLFDATRKHPSPKAFQRKLNGVYEPMSSAAFEALCVATALGLRALGISPGDRVGILARSSLDWAACDFAIQLCGALSVPIYPTLLAGPIGHILEHAGCRALFVEDAEQTAKVAPLRARLPDLDALIQFAGEAGSGAQMLAALRAAGASCGEAAAAALWETALAIGPEADCTLVYTSGTSGDPKGVLLSQRNIVSNVQAALAVIALGPTDTALSCLPLSHLLERTAGLHAMLHAGVSIAYAESVDTLAQNLLEVQPTVMIGVPRLYEKLYARVLARASARGVLRRRGFHWARRVSAAWTERRLAGRPLPLPLRCAHALADRLVFAQLRARTGGHLRFFVSGGAPLAPTISAFFYSAGLPILEGYGLTETSPILSVSSAAGLRLGSVGRALPGVELRIAGDGEILARGPQVMQGYYRDPAATQAVLDADGWFATGDIGELDADGYLRITDRKKDILVTAGGKNVAPQPIESRLKQDRFVSECILIGDRRPFIAALIVPDFAALGAYAEREGLPAGPPAALVEVPAILALVEQRVARLNAGLPPHEQIRAWRLLDHELTLGAGELTPSLKVRRHRVLASYADLVAAIYAESTPRARTLPPQ